MIGKGIGAAKLLLNKMGGIFKGRSLTISKITFDDSAIRAGKVEVIAHSKDMSDIETLGKKIKVTEGFGSNLITFFSVGNVIANTMEYGIKGFLFYEAAKKLGLKKSLDKLLEEDEKKKEFEEMMEDKLARLEMMLDKKLKLLDGQIENQGATPTSSGPPKDQPSSDDQSSDKE